MKCIIGDLVVIWRVWVIWGYCKKAAAGPALSWAATIGNLFLRRFTRKEPVLILSSSGLYWLLLHARSSAGVGARKRLGSISVGGGIHGIDIGHQLYRGRRGCLPLLVCYHEQIFVLYVRT